MWILYAILSSIFASLTSILAKVGIDGVDSNLATAVVLKETASEQSIMVELFIAIGTFIMIL